MNLLNKKLKDKIQLLDDIDRQYFPKEDSKRKIEQIPINKDNNDIYLNSIERMKNTKDENFDNVYSNFILDDKILNKNKYCRNNLNYFINNNICKYPICKCPTKNNSKNDNNYNKYNQRKINNNNNLKKLSKSKNNKTRNKTEKNELKLIQNYKKKLNTTNTKLNKTKNKSISKSKSKSKSKTKL